MLTTEYSARWLPMGTLASDDPAFRRVEIVQSGVFWGAADFADPVTTRNNFEDWFLPWNWQEIAQWQCYQVDGNGAVTRFPAGDVTSVPQNLTAWENAAGDLRKHYLEAIKHYAMDLAENGTPVALRAREICRPLDGLKHEETVDDTSPAPAHTGWLRSYLAQKAQSMHPTNVKLQMAWVSSALDPAVFTAECEYVWLPVSPAGGNWEGEPTVEPALTAQRHVRGQFAASAAATGTTLTALAGPTPLAAAPQTGGGPLLNPEKIIRYESDTEGAISFSPLRLRGPSMVVSDTQEWLTGLSRRAAGAMDLPVFLLGWLKTLIFKDSPLLAAAENGVDDVKLELSGFLNLCREYLIAASRDVIGFGRIPGPDRRYLAEDVWLRATAAERWFVAAQNDFVDSANVSPEEKSRSLKELRAALLAWEDEQENTLPQLWNDAVAQICGAELANPLERWPALGDATTVRARSVEEFVAAAEAYVNFVREPGKARKLILAQWQWLKTEWLGLDEKWVLESLAVITDPALDQAEGLLERFWKQLFAEQSAPEESARQIKIANNLLEAILQDTAGAWDSRFGAQDVLYPAIATDPFAAEPSADLAFLARAKFDDYITARFGIAEAFPDPNADLEPPNMDTVAAVLFPSRHLVYPAPQAIRVAVDQPSFGNQEENESGDLNDDLAGALLFVREEGTAQWRSLNLVEAYIVANGTRPDDPLEGVFLTPSPVGEQDGARVAYRRFDNEYPSIVATPENSDAPEPIEEEEDPETLAADQNRIVLELPRTHFAPCVHYGHDYRVAGAVMTNGGVLPAALRDQPNDAANLTIPRVTGWAGLEAAFAETNYECLRRVPVGPIRFATPELDDLKRELFPIPRPARPAVPVAEADRRQDESNRGIRPLACELPEWASDDPTQVKEGAEAKRRPKQNLLLIFPGTKPPQIDDGIFGTCKFRLLKPTTGFWNWFAWMDDWAACDEATRVEEWENELTQRQSGNERQTGRGPLDDPALENEVYCEIQQLFPTVSATSSLLIAYGSEVQSRPGRSGPIAVTVSIDPTLGVAVGVTPEPGTLSVQIPEGVVIRITFYSLVRRSHFVQDDATAAPPKFHEFMMDEDFIKGAKPANNSASQNCIAVTPVELWIEAAKNWQTAGLQNSLENALWQGLRIVTPHEYELVSTQVASVEVLPNDGRRKVIVAEIGNALHFRIFDADRTIALDLPEANLPLTDAERATEVTQLRAELQHWTANPIPEEEAAIIRHVTMMTAWKRDRKLQAWIDRSVSRVDLAQLGRLDVWHQVWRWDGREVPADLLAQMLEEAPEGRDWPESKSLEWDGVAFPIRPDYAHRSSPASLAVWREKGESPQDVFADNLADDLRSMYYRLSVRGFSRYEAVMGETAVLAYGIAQEAPKAIVKQPWRRAVVKATRTTKLAKPSVRFALPLTRDVFDSEVGAQTAASVMLVLDDVWFAENGLADQLEVGIRILTDPNEGGLRWVNAGFDPTLTAAPMHNTTKVDSAEKPLEVYQLEESVLGPYGLTYDFGAKIPKLRGSCYILRVPVADLTEIPNSSDRLPWFMCEIITRRVLRPEAADLPHGVKADDLAGEWSARTWVQFVPNTELLWPAAWRSACSGAAPKNITVDDDAGELRCNIPALTRFDDSFEERHERWLVLAEQITDIKGHPAERYRATFVDEGVAGEPRFVLRDGEEKDMATPDDAEQLRHGYLRLLLVRRRPNVGALQTGKIWQSLFATEEEHREEVMDDALRVMPIVTGRVPVLF